MDEVVTPLKETQQEIIITGNVVKLLFVKAKATIGISTDNLYNLILKSIEGNETISSGKIA